MASLTFFVTGLVMFMAGFASCQYVTLGSCPDVKTQEKFDLNRYLGKWYENRRYSNLFSLFSNCVTAEYSMTSPTSVQVNNTGWKYLSGYYDNAIGEAVILGDGKLGVRFYEFQPYEDYWVLSTDYTSYSIVWSCTESPRGPVMFNSQYLWLLTRSPDGVSEERMETIMDLLKGYNIEADVRKLKPTAQQNCNYDMKM